MTTLLAVLLILIVFVILVIILIALHYSYLIVYSHRQPLIRSPRDYGLKYEKVEFKSSDGLLVKGWFIPGSSKKAVIINHPWTFNRHGFEPKNQGLIKLFKTRVDILKAVKAIHEAGYPILIFDFRNHGESSRGITGIGVNEYRDAQGALNYLKTRNEIDHNHIGLVDFCMAGNAFMALAAKNSEPRCLIAIQPVSLAISTKRYLKKLTSSLVAPVIVWLIGIACQLRGGYSLASMSPLQFAHHIKIPTLYIQAEKDPWGTVADVKSFYEATRGQRELWIIKGNMVRFDTYNYVGEHPEKLINFLNKYP